MRGLKFVLSICMGSSFGKVAKGWVGITSEKFFCVVDVGSWHFSCQCLKSFLSHWTTCAMAWLNVERFGKMNNKPFTSLHNPNWNSFMNDPWNIASQFFELRCIYHNWMWYLTKWLYLNAKCAFFVQISKSGIKLFKKCFKVIEQGWLVLQQRCKPNKGCA